MPDHVRHRPRDLKPLGVGGIIGRGIKKAQESIRKGSEKARRKHFGGLEALSSEKLKRK